MSYYEADGLGSTTSLTNASGTTAATYAYDAFGNLSGSTGALTNPFRYTSREFDSETGLHFYRNRYYDPAAGRFLSEDPLGFGGGINKYSYVMNMPVNWVDPNGLGMSAAQCLELLKDIQRRVEILSDKIAKYDPIADGVGGATYQAGGQVRRTVPGSHFGQIVGMQVNLWLDIAKYQKECGEGPRIPCDVFRTVNRRVPEPIYPKTLMELQLDEEAARYMEEFWRDILVGDGLVGIVGTGGAFGVFEGAGAGAGAGGLVPALAH